MRNSSLRPLGTKALRCFLCETAALWPEAVLEKEALHGLMVEASASSPLPMAGTTKKTLGTGGGGGGLADAW